MNSIGQQYTFWNLIKKYKIVVPKIQRDYVQGRKNKTVEKNREEFVKELIDSLTGGRLISLNFVYGTIQNDNEFIPIDGQQRLTTLFLLHLYVFAKKEDTAAIEKLQKQFSYQTRYTTNRFLEKLAGELPKMLNSTCNVNLIDIIRDSGWYVTPWDNDPNICSCLVMLQTIHAAYKDKGMENDIDNICKRLKGEEGNNCPITFMWLQLDKSFGSDNQLYIRMNSRGKQLTDFENFKAELYEKVLAGEETEEFKKKIDGEWYSMLWDANVAESNVKDDKKIDIEKEALLIDSLLKRLIHWMIVSKACVERSIILKKERGGNKKELAKDEDAVKQKEEHDNLYQYCMPDGNEKIDVLRCGVEEYQSLVGKDGIKTCITEDLNSLLTFWVQLKEDTIFKYIVQDILAVSDNKGKNIYNIDSYSPRVLLYAITKFAKVYGEEIDESGTINDFKSWYRVILNLVSTKEIGRPEDYQKAVWAIAKWDKVTAKWLEEKAVKNAFRPEQVEEEKQKLNLIKSGEKWKDAILQAEKTNFDQDYQKRDYFRGQIGFLLHMAGVEMTSIAKLNSENLQNFKYYSEAVQCIFDYDNYWSGWKCDEITNKPMTVDEIKSAEECSFDNIFHRAMLNHGNYWVNAPGNNIKTFFVYYESHNNYDWRGAFRQKDDKVKAWGTAVDCLKDLLDNYKPKNPDKYSQEYKFDFDDFKDYLVDRIKAWAVGQIGNSNVNETAEERRLRDLLIQNPNCFKYIRNNYYIYWNDTEQEYLLMSLKRFRKDSFIDIKKELQGQTP